MAVAIKDSGGGILSPGLQELHRGKCRYRLVCISILCVQAVPLPLSFKCWSAQSVRFCLVKKSVHHNI